MLRDCGVGVFHVIGRFVGSVRSARLPTAFARMHHATLTICQPSQWPLLAANAGLNASGGSMTNGNIDIPTVEGFGEEWDSFDQTPLSPHEWQMLFNRYFAIFPWDDLPPEPQGFDLGCGSGGWAAGVVDRVRTLHCIDPSDKALAVAKRRLADKPGVQFHHAGVDDIPLPDNSPEFGYSLGVLPHFPASALGMRDCVHKLKPGAPLLVYLYYRFDNRPAWFRALWGASDVMRRAIARMPFRLRKAVTTGIAATVYWPLARGAGFLEMLGANVEAMPLSPYRTTSFYSMRTDALDRFGTRLEQRFTRPEITQMMTDAGLVNIRFSDNVPYWVACGFKR